MAKAADLEGFVRRERRSKMAQMIRTIATAKEAPTARPTVAAVFGFLSRPMAALGVAGGGDAELVEVDREVVVPIVVGVMLLVVVVEVVVVVETLGVVEAVVVMEVLDEVSAVEFRRTHCTSDAVEVKVRLKLQ